MPPRKKWVQKSDRDFEETPSTSSAYEKFEPNFLAAIDVGTLSSWSINVVTQ